MQPFVDKKRKNFLEGFFVKMALAAPTTAPHEGLTCWMEEQITDLEKFNKNKLGELFYDLPLEMQTRIFSFLAPMTNSSDTLQAAAAVNRHCALEVPGRGTKVMGSLPAGHHRQDFC